MTRDEREEFVERVDVIIKDLEDMKREIVGRNSDWIRHELSEAVYELEDIRYGFSYSPALDEVRVEK